MVNSSRKEVKAYLSSALAQGLDDLLFHHHFDRRQKSLIYRRKTHESSQELDFAFDLHPRYRPNADAHLLPVIRIVIPELGRVALEMAEDGSPPRRYPDIILTEQLGNVAPKEHYQRWFLTGEAEAISTVMSVRLFVDRWGIPFLNEYDSIRSITVAYEKTDKRVGMDRQMIINVAAAYVILGDRDKARNVLLKELGLPGVRRFYEKAFQYLQIPKKNQVSEG